MAVSPLKHRFTTSDYHAMLHAGILTWLLVLQEKILDVHREPTADGYRTRHRLRPGVRASPQAFPDLVLDVAELLG
jgi:Uma2 family endonuclease